MQNAFLESQRPPILLANSSKFGGSGANIIRAKLNHGENDFGRFAPTPVSLRKTNPLLNFEEDEFKWQVYNFEVAEHHTYIANGVRVHNQSLEYTLNDDGTIKTLTNSIGEDVPFTGSYTPNQLQFYGRVEYDDDGNVTEVVSGTLGEAMGSFFRSFADVVGLDGQVGLQGTYVTTENGLETDVHPSDGTLPAPPIVPDGDQDNDGTPDWRDEDYSNIDNYLGDRDGDGVPNIVDFDDGVGYLDKNRGGEDDTSGSGKPVVLDLDGDGIEITVGGQTSFDVDLDGFKEPVSWVAPDDGFLVIDLNSDNTRGEGDGNIDSVFELAFSLWSQNQVTDLEALATAVDVEGNLIFDSNGDGILDESDSIWNELKVWQDLDQDGETEGDGAELKSLADWGITSINLSYDDGSEYADLSNDVNLLGNSLLGTASYVRNGETFSGGVGDVSLAFDIKGHKKIEQYGQQGTQFETGNLILHGSDAGENLVGGSQADLFIAGEGSDTIEGNTGSDTVSYANSMSSVDVDFALGVGQGGYAQGDQYLGVENLIGSDYADVLVGSVDNNVIHGGQGDDTIEGGSGDDTLDGGSGSDLFVIQETFGNDKIAGGFDLEGETDTLDLTTLSAPWSVTLLGIGMGRVSDDQGNTLDFESIEHILLSNAHTIEDQTDGTSGVKLEISVAETVSNMSGTSADEIIHGNSNSNLFHGNAGSDEIIGRGGEDVLFGGSGDDLIFGDSRSALDEDFDGSTNSNNIAANSSDDLHGGEGEDTLVGGEGDDTLSGGTGNDVLNGGFGSDTFRVSDGFGTDIVDGGFDLPETVDTLDLTLLSSAVTLTLTGQGAGSVADDQGNSLTFESIEHVLLSNSYTLVDQTGGTSGIALEIKAGGAVTDIDGANADETIDGNSQANLLLGNGGNDDINGGLGADTIDGGSGDDLIFGDSRTNPEGEDDSASFGGGLAGSQADSLVGADGMDTIFGGEDNDTLEGGAGADELSGGTGADSIDGGTGADLLRGGDGVDTLTGGHGDDTLNGGEEADRLEGGAGDDLYVVSLGESGETIFDHSTTDLVEEEYVTTSKGGTQTINTRTVEVENLDHSGNDTLSILNAYDFDELAFVLSGNDLLVSHVLENGNSTHVLTIEGWLDPNNRVEFIELENGLSLDVSEIEVVASDLTAVDVLDVHNLDGEDQSQQFAMLVGLNGDDVLTGGSGSDILLGGRGNDTLASGSGEDVVLGGAGDDTYVVSIGEGSATILDHSESVEDIVEEFVETSKNGTEVVNTRVVEAVVRHDAGQETLSILGAQNFDEFSFELDGDDLKIEVHSVGQPGDEFLSIQDWLDPNSRVEEIQLESGVSIDVSEVELVASDKAGHNLLEAYYLHGAIYSEHKNTLLVGLDENDQLIGGNGKDVLLGGQGDDTISGGDSDDQILGGHGFDILSGGFGADEFIFAEGDGVDTIQDFGVGEDALVVFGDFDQNADLLNNLAEQVGANTVVDLGDGDQVTLLDVELTDLQITSLEDYGFTLGLM